MIILITMIITTIIIMIIVQFAWNPPAISHPESVLKYRLFYRQVNKKFGDNDDDRHDDDDEEQGER